MIITLKCDVCNSILHVEVPEIIQEPQEFICACGQAYYLGRYYPFKDVLMDANSGAPAIAIKDGEDAE